MLNNDQIKLVQTAVRKAGIRTATFDGRYRMLLSQYTQPNGHPVTSCKQLNNSQLDDILAICEASGWRMQGKPEDYYRDKVNKSYEIASFAQQQAIKYLAADIGVGDNRLSEFIKHQTSGEADSVAALTPKQAYRVIEGFKAIMCKKTGQKLNTLKDIKDYCDKGATDGKEQNQIG